MHHHRAFDRAGAGGGFFLESALRTRPGAEGISRDRFAARPWRKCRYFKILTVGAAHDLRGTTIALLQPSPCARWSRPEHIRPNRLYGRVRSTSTPIVHMVASGAYPPESFI